MDTFKYTVAVVMTEAVDPGIQVNLYTIEADNEHWNDRDLHNRIHTVCVLYRRTLEGQLEGLNRDGSLLTDDVLMLAANQPSDALKNLLRGQGVISVAYTIPDTLMGINGNYDYFRA